MDNARQFKALNANRTWDVLAEANQYHVSAGQRYLYLLKDLETQRVAFNDIGNFILNEAKRAGLYRKINGGYASKNQLKKQNEAWFVAYKNFMAWLRNNYAGSYDKQITAAMKAEMRAQKKAEKSQKKTTTITRTPDGQEARTEIVETTADMDAPVSASLSASQVEAIFAANWSVLAGMAESKGAVAEYNAFMIKIGQPDEVIEVAAAN